MTADRATGGAYVTRRSLIQFTGAALALPAAPIQSSNLENWRMSFTPKFVDLVRNYTTTTGTADFVLGAAVNGYSSFASALQVGDNFYYSAIGIDKPIEREVGRGTMNADGTIGRDPISGIKTSFTSGIKSLSLIAAAEWYNSIQAGSGATAAASAPTSAASRTALAGMSQTQLPMLLCEAGREGLFAFDPSNLSAKVASDAYQAIYIAPSSDATGASGAWVRRDNGPIQACWAGFCDGAASNAARLESLIGLADPTRGNVIELPLGTVTMDRRVVVSRPCVIRGRGGARGQSGGSGNSELVFPAGSTGFRVKHDTVTGGGQQTRIENVKIAQSAVLSTTQAGTFNASSPHTITLDAPGDFQNGQVIWLEGAGQTLIVPGRTATIAAGSNTVTVASTGGYGNAIGYVGQVIDVAGAGLPANTTITAWGPGSITLSKNATTSVAGAAISVKSPLVAEIQSGGGTTSLTVDSMPATIGNVSGATIRHAAPAIYCTTQMHGRGIEVGGDAQVGIVLAGITSDGSVADGGSFYDCMFAASLAGVVLQGGDAQVNSFYSCDFAGPQISVLDSSYLGNYFYGCHWAFNMGIQVFEGGAETQLHGGYFETYTGFAAPLGGRASFFATTSLVNGGGFKGITVQQGGLEVPGLTSKGHLACQDDGLGNGAFQATGDSLFDGMGAVKFANGAGGSGNRLRIFMNGASGMYLTGATDMWFNAESGGIQFRLGDITQASVNSSGFNLAPGKALQVAGTQVVGARATGWTAASGSASRGAFAAAPAGSASASYAQGELQGALDRIAAIEARLVAYDSDLRAHGLIGS